MPIIAIIIIKTKSGKHQRFPRNYSRSSHFHHHLVFLGMVLWASYFDPLNNWHPFAPPIYHGLAPIISTGTAAQITEFVCLYKDDKETFTTYCEFRIILISMITIKFPEKYKITLKNYITRFCQCETLTLLTHLYTEYGIITSYDLTENLDGMTAHCSTPTPIADLI